MEQPIHSLASLFKQLGLDADDASIDAFIAQHSPLPEGMKISEAPFWIPAQAALLKDEILEDADWAVVVDELNVRLHPQH